MIHFVLCAVLFFQLDGYIARRFPSQMSYLGSVLDPVADKLLVGILTVTLSMVHLIPGNLSFACIVFNDVQYILSNNISCNIILINNIGKIL